MNCKHCGQVIEPDAENGWIHSVGGAVGCGLPFHDTEVYAEPDDTITDADAHVTYTPHTDPASGALGFKVEGPRGTEYIMLNPSRGSDDGVPTVFVYQGPTGDPAEDEPQHFYAPFEGERTTPLRQRLDEVMVALARAGLPEHLQKMANKASLLLEELDNHLEDL